MKHLIAFLASCFGALIIYLAFVFGNATFDIIKWVAEARFFCAALMLVAFGIIFIIVENLD